MLELANVVADLRELGQTDTEIAQRFGCSPTHIANLSILRGAPESIRLLIRDEVLTPSRAINLLRKHGPEEAAARLSAAAAAMRAAGDSVIRERHFGQPRSAGRLGPEQVQDLVSTLESIARASLDETVKGAALAALRRVGLAPAQVASTAISVVRAEGIAHGAAA
jgi:hypothetical protein